MSSFQSHQSEGLMLEKWARIAPEITSENHYYVNFLYGVEALFLKVGRYVKKLSQFILLLCFFLASCIPNMAILRGYFPIAIFD